jgi:Protein of unknown function (DUF2934)
MARSTKATRTILSPGGDDIARRAFELYCARGCEDGHDVQDWLQAERELCEATATVELRPRPARKSRATEPRRAAVGDSAAASA